MPPSIRTRPSPTTEQARETNEATTAKKADNTIRRDSTQQQQATTTSALPDTSMMMATTNPMYSSSMYGGYGGGYGMGGGYGGVMGGYGGIGSPYGGMMTPGPMSSLNQFLFGVQNVIFSLGQAVQIVGMNTQALQQLLDTATTMFDHALGTFREMRTLDAISEENESEEDKKRRRRLRALRWAMMVGVAYAGYRVIRRIMRRKRQAIMSQQGSRYPPTTAMVAPNNATSYPYGTATGASPSYPSNYGGTSSLYSTGYNSYGSPFF